MTDVAILKSSLLLSSTFEYCSTKLPFHQRLNNEGISRELIVAFLVYLIGHNRPITELLAPRAKPLAEVYESEFKGMTFDDVGVEALEDTLPRLAEMLHDNMTEEDKALLLSFKAGTPNWEHLGIPHIEQLPSVRWKLMNLDKMKNKKRVEAIANLEAVLRDGHYMDTTFLTS